MLNQLLVSFRDLYKQADIVDPVPYLVDTNNIYVAGQSAGATLANLLGYYTSQSMINEVFPVPPGKLPIDSVLGPIDADLYKGPVNIDYQSKIKLVCSQWGAFPIPKDSSYAGTEFNYLSQNGTQNMPNFIGFMGALDPVFSPQKRKQWVYYPPVLQTDYTTESSCLRKTPFKVYGNQPAFRLECTNDIYRVFKANNLYGEQYIDCNMGHGLQKSHGIITTNFGITSILLTYLKDVNDYIASRTAFLIQASLNGTIGSLTGASKFTDCENFRHSPTISGACATDAYNDSCYDSKKCE